MSWSQPLLDPLPPDTTPELEKEFESFLKTLGFVPNSVLTMQRKPALVRAFVQMQRAIWDPEGKVDRGFKRLIAHAASRAVGDAYSMAHTASGALHFGIDPVKLAAVPVYAESPLFSEAERAALDLAVAACRAPGSSANATSPTLARFWTAEQIVEIVAVIAMAGFLSRWNMVMSTPLEPESMAVGNKYLAALGWSPGIHAGK
jgi:alkylhydroperoxidase family enzyme